MVVVESPQVHPSTAAPFEPRRSRDRLLGDSAAILAASSLVLAVADFLGLMDLIHTGQPSGFRIASGCWVASDLILVFAFSIGNAAFLSRLERRSRRLEVGATLAALGAGVGLVGAAIAAAASVNHGYPGSYITSVGLRAAGGFAVVFAALAVARGFSATVGSAPDAITRESWLGWAAGGFAASYGFAMLSQVFMAHYLHAAGMTSAYTTGVDGAILGSAIALRPGE